MNARDPEGILLRNGLWAGAFAGIAGGPMPWWWDNWIAPRGLDRHAKALSAFLRETKDAQTPTPMRIEDDRLRVLALRGPRAVRLWVQDRESSWHARIERRVPPRRLSGAISLSGFPPGRWRLRWFDTAAGTFTEATLLDAPEGALRLDLPPFLGDAAACLTLEETP